MSLLTLLAALCGQLPSAQAAAPLAAPPAAQPTVLLLQYAAPAVPVAPQPAVLVAAPPLWDRCLAKLGQKLQARAAAHQHIHAATIATAATTATPLVVQVVAQPVQTQNPPPVLLQAVPRATPQSEAAPPPPAASPPAARKAG